MRIRCERFADELWANRVISVASKTAGAAGLNQVLPTSLRRRLPSLIGLDEAAVTTTARLSHFGKLSRGHY